MATDNAYYVVLNWW